MPKVSKSFYYIIIRFVNYKAKLQELKPLEFFEEVLVYDTFQWEDEFNHNHHNAHSDDHKKQSIDEELTDKILSGHEKVANFSDKRKLTINPFVKIHLFITHLTVIFF